MSVLKRSTGKGRWDTTISGAQMVKFRKREGMTKREVADRLGVNVRTVNAWEDGMEPQQEFIAPLLDLYGVEPDEYRLLWPVTEAEADRRRDYDERRADLTKQAVGLDEEWQPVRFRH